MSDRLEGADVFFIWVFDVLIRFFEVHDRNGLGMVWNTSFFDHGFHILATVLQI